jgi:hypothetical protein
MHQYRYFTNSLITVVIVIDISETAIEVEDILKIVPGPDPDPKSSKSRVRWLFGDDD